MTDTLPASPGRIAAWREPSIVRDDMNRSTSTRIVALVVLALVVLIGGCLALLATFGPGPAATQGERSVTVEVMFPTTAGEAVGEKCGYSVLGGVSPQSRQVIVRDAAGVIVGTVDLLDVFNPVVQPAPENALPGIVNDEDLCVVTSTVSVLVSPFYTFTIEGLYDWTVSRDSLEQRDWSMRVEFFHTD